MAASDTRQESTCSISLNVTNSVLDTFLYKLIHFSDLSETAYSGGVLGTSPGGSFLTPKSRVFDGFWPVGSET